MYRIFIMTILVIGLSAVLAQQQPAPKNLAIMDFEVRGDASKHLGETIADMIACHIKPVGYHVIERRHLKKVMKERLIKIDTVIDNKKLMAIGASHLLVGFIDKTEDVYSGGYRVVKVDTAVREDQLNDYIKGAKDYKDFVANLSESLENERQKALLKQNIITAAAHLVREIGPWLKQSKPKTGPYKVGVFAFGDQNGQATAILGNLPVLMQGELTDQLRAYLGKEAPGKYTLLDADQLKIVFLMLAASPLGINPKTLSVAPKILEKIRLDVGIVGRYQTVDPQNTLSTAVLVEANAIFANSKQVLKAKVGVGAKDVQRHAGINQKKSTGRFQVDFFYKPDDRVPDEDKNGWRRLNLFRVKNPESKYYNGYFMVLKRNMEGKRYKIRMINNGKPAINQKNALDKDRLFAASLLIDGVNSIYQDKGNGRKGPVVLHPLKVSKWVLSAPHRELIPGPKGMVRKIGNSAVTKIVGGSLIDVQGPGDSRIEILGFQKNKNFADAFVFARPGDSIAETVGITDSIGMIAVYFYPEKLPQDERAGTKPGKEVKSPTFAISFKIEAEPVEVMRVFYRYEDDLPCGKEDLELIK